MRADFYAVLDNFKNFIGGRAGLLHWVLFCFALGSCLFLGKKERKLFFWPAVLVLFFFFNPLFYRYIGTKFLSGVYWRLLWMLPVAIVVCYVLVQLFCRLGKKPIIRLLAAALCILLIAATGERIYSAGTFTKAENVYKLPQEALDVADIMAAAGVNWKVRAVVPNELLCYIRQYRCDIGLFYGRNAGGFISEIGEDEQRVYEEMSRSNPDVSVITELCRKNEVIFLCFNRATQDIPDDLSEYGYQLYRTTGDYSIYQLQEMPVT